MTTTTTEVTFLRSIKGAPATVLLAMALLGRGQAVGCVTLTQATGYSRPTVTAALGVLEAVGLVQRHGRYESWMLTVSARQFILGEMAPTLDCSEGKTFSLAPCSSSYIHELDSEEDTSTTNMSDVKNFSLELDADGEAAVALLIEAGRWERTKEGKGARDAVEAAVSGGWTGAQCLKAAEGWLEYARSAKQLYDPAGFAAYALREMRAPPVRAAYQDKDDPQRYIKGKYADLILS